MKTKETTPGKTYSVHTASGCTVSDKNGWNKTIDAPDGYFTAHVNEVTIDGDDEASIKELFKLAHRQRFTILGVLMGDRGLPAGYLAAEFLENHSPGAIRVPVNKPLAGYSFEQCHAYTSDETGAEAAVISGTHLRVQIGEWNRANLFVWVVRSQAGGSYLPDTKKTMRVDVASDGAKVYLDNAFLFEQTGEIVGTVTAFDLFSRNSTECFAGKKYWVKMKHNGELIRDLVPCISPDGKPAFYDKASKTHFAANDTSGYIAGMTIEQARYLRKLPVIEVGTLTISLPWEAQWDAGVQNALSVATTRGWIITVQYRDPEVATENIPASFLESTGEQYIRTSIVPNASTGIEAEYEITNPYSGSRKNVIGSQSQGGQTMFILMGSGYGWNNTRKGVSVTNYGRLNWKGNRLYENGTTVIELPPLNFTPRLPLFMFCLNYAGSKDELTPQKIKWVKIDNGEKLISHFVPSLTADGVPCMHDKVTTQSLSNSGSGQFIVGFDTAEQARKLATLPDVTAETDTTKKSLTISLPWEAQWDEGTQAALQVAADRGWIITVQYRDPEIATTNIPVSFLESTGRQYIKATALFNNNTKLEMLARRTGSSVNSSFFGTEHYGVANVTTNRFSLLVNSKGEARFDYGPSMVYSDFVIKEGVCYKITKDAEKNYIDGVLIVSNSPAVFDGMNGVIFARGAGPSYMGAVGGLNCAIYWCNIFNSGKPEHAFVPALTEKGVPCMYDKVSKTPFLNSGLGQFIAGFDTIEQARKLATLPDVTAETAAAKKSLTVSLPWEAQLVVTGVPAALQVAADRGWIITVQYRDPEADNAYYNKYATCTTVAKMAAVNPKFRTDLTYDGGWIYPLPELTNLANIAWGGDYSPEMPLKYIDCDAPKVKFTNPGFVHNCQPKWARGDWSGVQSGMWMFGSGTKKVLSNVEMVFPKLQIGDAMFEGAILNKESVLRIFGSIPSYTSGTHKLTIGIHVDHELDEEIAATIADAEARGWTVEEQWNGTATAQTASTFGLRRRPVYAKLSEYEGKQYLSWGHYVTNWETNGYQEFTSVEEAEEYFNIGD